MALTREEIFGLNQELSLFVKESLTLKLKRDLGILNNWTLEIAKEIGNVRNAIIKELEPNGSIPIESPSYAIFKSKFEEYTNEMVDLPKCWVTLSFEAVADIKTTNNYPLMYKLMFV